MLSFILIPAGIVAAFFGGVLILTSGITCTLTTTQRVPSDFLSIGACLKTYRINGGQYPSTEQGLVALAARPDTGPQPEKWIQIITKIPSDPWGREYRYRLLSDGKDFELRSAGPDGSFGTKDDISTLDE